MTDARFQAGTRTDTIRTLAANLWEAALQHAAASTLGRLAAESLLRARSRRLLMRLDQADAARTPLCVLLGLLNQARHTRFGIDHDFRRIRTVADYRRLVPLTTRADLWRDYWEPALPHLAGVTWPALPSAALRASNTAALRTALAFAAHARPHQRLLGGRFVWLGDEVALSPDAARPTPARQGRVRPRLFALEVRPYTAEGTTPVTCAGGSLVRLLHLFERVQRAAGCDRVRDVWPHLAAVFYSRRLTDPDAAALRAVVGDGVLLLELGVLREGVVAVEDPRYGLLRLLPEHGVYCEFVPAAEAGDGRAVDAQLDAAEEAHRKPGRADDDVRRKRLAGLEPDAVRRELRDASRHHGSAALPKRLEKVAVRDDAEPLIPRLV